MAGGVDGGDVDDTTGGLPPLDPTGGGAAGKNVEDLTEKIEDLNEQIDENTEAAKAAGEELTEFYEGVQSEIDELIAKQKELSGELETFTLEKNTEALDDFAERLSEIGGEIGDLETERAEIQLEITGVEDDEQRAKLREQLEGIADEIAQLEQERAFIATLDLEVGGEDFQAKLQERAAEITEFNNLSNAEQIEATRQRALDEKAEEIAIEQAKIQELIDIRQKFLDLTLSKEAETQRKLAELAKNAAEGSLGDVEERQRLLDELGFEELTKEQELELLKQIQRQQSIAQEIDEIKRKEEELLAIREEFLALADEATLESVDNRISAYEREIKKIDQLIAKINQLNDLGGVSGANGTTNNTDNSTVNNVNIQQNITTGVDAEAANQSLINQL